MRIVRLRLCVCAYSSAIAVPNLPAVAHGREKKKIPIFWPLSMTPSPNFCPKHAQIFALKTIPGAPGKLGDNSPSRFRVISEHTYTGLHKDRHANMSGKYVSGNPALDSLPACTKQAVSRACAINKLSSCPKNNHVSRTRFAA